MKFSQVDCKDSGSHFTNMATELPRYHQNHYGIPQRHKESFDELNCNDKITSGFQHHEVLHWSCSICIICEPASIHLSGLVEASRWLTNKRQLVVSDGIHLHCPMQLGLNIHSLPWNELFPSMNAYQTTTHLS